MLRVSRQLSWGKLLLVFVIIAAAAMLSSTTSFAAVTSTNANVDLKAPPPSSVLESDNANSSEIWIFQEKSVNLGSALAIDQANTNPSTTIASGTTINSYFIHLGKGGSSGLSGTVTFDEPILGVIKVNSKLDATDFLLGLSGTTYQVGNFQTSALALAATDGTVIKLPIEQVVQFWNGDSTHEDNTGGVSVRITHRSSPGTICGCEQQST